MDSKLEQLLKSKSEFEKDIKRLNVLIENDSIYVQDQIEMKTYLEKLLALIKQEIENYKNNEKRN